MSVAAGTDRLGPRRRLGRLNLGDRIFRWGSLLFAAAVLVIVGLLVVVLFEDALPAMHQFGWGFLSGAMWNPVRDIFGAWPFIFGTLVSSAVALVIAVPLSLGTAIFLAELAPAWLRNPVSFMVELLAAVPSVVYGLWGLFVLVPLLRPVEGWLQAHVGKIRYWPGRAWEVPLFTGTPLGLGVLAAGLILAIMILPIITAVSREVLLAVPRTQREAAYALGATRWEAIRGPVLRYARAGILGAVILGLGRALGETMAVTMVIGNTPTVSASLFSPGYTMPSVLANEHQEATTPLHISALMEIAFLLFIIVVVVNIVARVLLWSVARGARGVPE